MYEAGSVTAMLYLILMAAPIFTYFINLAHVPETLVHWIEGHQFPPLGVIFTLTAVYILLGTFFEEMSSILITLPLVLPIIVSLGYDPLWWGVICLIQVEMALIHPPLGIIVFLLHAIAPKISMGTIYRGVVPFLVADFAVLIILILLPGIVLWLPHALIHWALRSGGIGAGHLSEWPLMDGRGWRRQCALRSIQRRQKLRLSVFDRQRRRYPDRRQAAEHARAETNRNGDARRLRIDLAILDRIALRLDCIQKLGQALRLARSDLPAPLTATTYPGWRAAPAGAKGEITATGGGSQHRQTPADHAVIDRQGAGLMRRLAHQHAAFLEGQERHRPDQIARQLGHQRRRDIRNPVVLDETVAQGPHPAGETVAIMRAAAVTNPARLSVSSKRYTVGRGRRVSRASSMTDGSLRQFMAASKARPRSSDRTLPPRALLCFAPSWLSRLPDCPLCGH